MLEINTKSMRIGQIAKAADIGIDTIRFYERRGLLPQPERTESGYRRYPPHTITRLRFIRRAKDLGFSLDEIASLLTLQDTNGSKSSVKAITRHKIEAITARIDDLCRMREVLTQLHNDCSGKGSVAGCPIIETLAKGNTSEQKRRTSGSETP